MESQLDSNIFIHMCYNKYVNNMNNMYNKYSIYITFTISSVLFNRYNFSDSLNLINETLTLIFTVSEFQIFGTDV